MNSNGGQGYGQPQQFGYRPQNNAYNTAFRQMPMTSGYRNESGPPGIGGGMPPIPGLPGTGGGFPPMRTESGYPPTPIPTNLPTGGDAGTVNQWPGYIPSDGDAGTVNPYPGGMPPPTYPGTGGGTPPATYPGTGGGTPPNYSPFVRDFSNPGPNGMWGI